MSQFIEDLQYKIKTSSGSLFLFSFKFLIGSILGLTFALIGQQMTAYGTLAFFLVIAAAIGVFYKISQSWKWSQCFIFSLFCVLVAMLLQMYIQVAPGA